MDVSNHVLCVCCKLLHIWEDLRLLCAKFVESFIIIQFYFLERHKNLVYNAHCLWLCKVEES
jgi:hypothetical protein